MSSQIRQNYSTELEAASAAWAACICGRPHLPLDDVALEGGGRFFLELAEKLEGAERLLEMQTQRGGRLLLQDEQKPPRDEWAQLRAPCQPPGLGEEPDPGPSGPADLQHWLLENHFRVRGETHQEDGPHLPALRRLRPQAGRGECLFQRLPLKHD